MDVVKAIIPAAGLGLRFFPATKAIPKELIPIGNKPAIQYSIEEAFQSGISSFTFITNKRKYAIADFLESEPAIELLLKDKTQRSLFTNLERLIRHCQFSYIRQPEPLGLGHAISLARQVIGKEYFAVLLPDDIIIEKTPVLAQLLRIAKQEKASVIAVQEVPRELTHQYGVIDVKKQFSPSLFQISQLVEKPSPKDSPSNLAIVGRYVLSPKIFNSLDTLASYSEGELQLTDAIGHMIHSNEKVFAYKIQGMRYDIGNPIGWTKAIISNALQDPEQAPAIKKFLESLESPESFLYNPIKTIEHTV